MLDSPHTSAPMLMRGTSLPQRAFHPTDHVQQNIHPTDNPPPSARKSGAGEARRRVGRRRGRPPSSARQNLRALVMQSCAPAPGAPSPWDSALGAIEDSISQCPFLQMTYTAENPHADGSAAPGARPRLRPRRVEQMLVRKIKDIRVTAIVTAMSFVLNDVLMKGGSQILKRANYL